MPKISFKIAFALLFYGCLFIFLFAHSFSYLDPDFGWHLKMGEEILASRQVPHFEHYDYTIEGKRWVDHEWLANVGMFWIYSQFGYVAESAVFSLLVIAVLVLMHHFVNRYFLQGKTGGTFFIFLFQILGITAAIGHLGVRVQEIALLALVALLFIMEHFKKHRKWQILIWFVPLFYLWASAHGSFLIGIAILVGWILFHSFALLVHKNKNISRLRPFLNFSIFSQSSILHFSIWSIFAFAATLLTPYYGELYSYLGDWSDRYYATHIQEWLTPFSPPIAYWQVLYLAIFILAIWLFVTLNDPKKPLGLDLWYLCLSALFFGLAVRSMRHFPLFFIVSFPIIVPFFASFTYLPKNAMGKEKKAVIYVFRFAISSLIVLIGAYCLAKVELVHDPFRGYFSDYPCQAVDYLKNSPADTNLKLFNEYNWGGYLIWAWPEKKLFVDGRMPQFRLAENTLLEEYHNFFDPDLIEEKLNAYGIEAVLVSVKDQPNKLDWFERRFLILNYSAGKKNSMVLRKYLEKSPLFEKVYADETAAVYRRKADEPGN